LIYGGSTSVGLFALQLAKLAGYKVISTSSPRNFDLVKRYGADEVVDYHDAEAAVKAIRDKTDGKLAKVLDTISEGESFKICLESFADEGKRKYNALLSVSEEGKKLAEEKGIETEFTLAYTLLGNVSPVHIPKPSLIPCRPSNSSRDRPSPPCRLTGNSMRS
jgi:D-arabinose 1-dehydrogenase-like Zn-dependent alcohol dehydrogenase